MTASELSLAPDYVGYPEIRRAVGRLLADHPGSAADPVPSCPEWTVLDLLAHLVEIAERVLVRFGEAVPPEGPREIGALLARWDSLGSTVDGLLAEARGGRGEILVMDAFTHELDLRGALGVAPPEAHVAWASSFAVLVRGFSGSAGKLELPALKISTTGGEWLTGEDPVATVSAEPHDLYRSFAGRRSPDQISALTWSGDPAPWLPAFTWGPFVPPAEPVEA